MAQKSTYADSGVNIDLGDDVSKILYNAAKRTWDNRKGKLGEVIVPFDDFTGVRAIDVSHLPTGTLMNIGFDGVGTKMELAERVKNHRTIAYDLFAMVTDDAVVRGAEPVLIGSILDVNSLGTSEKPFIEEIRQLAEGYIGAAKAANVAIVNGEVAELGNRVGGFGSFNYNWGAAVVWFANRDRLFTGKEIKEGDYLVGLREEGFRSNGLSLVRKIMKNNHGDNWHQVPWKRGNTSLADLALTPSKIYTAAVVDMFGGYNGEPKTKVHGVAHITGGGVPGKLGRILKPSQLGAIIDAPFEPSEFMKYTQALGNVSDIEAYKTWNMGQGMVIITPDPEGVIKIASEYGIKSKKIGYVTRDSQIRIKNEGAYNPRDNPEIRDDLKGPKELVF
ncbi:MAG: AIR synthase-related protein [Candidatus Diapherotrites archaeon]